MVKNSISQKQSILLSDELPQLIAVSFINSSTVQLLCFKQVNVISPIVLSLA